MVMRKWPCATGLMEMQIHSHVMHRQLEHMRFALGSQNDHRQFSVGLGVNDKSGSEDHLMLIYKAKLTIGIAKKPCKWPVTRK